MSRRTRPAARLIEASIVLALSASYFSHVFRLPDRMFLTSALGDWVDPYFINFLLEHWYHSFWTLSDPSSPPMYFPVGGTLGYSHGLILYAPFYVAVRSLLDPFQAYNVTLFLVMETGALCLYVIVRSFLRLGFIESLLLSAFFFTSANVVNGGTGVWSQRASVFLIPPILLMALVSVRLPRGRSRLSLACAAGLLSSLLFVQDFYTGALAALVCALSLPGALLAAPPPERGDRRHAWRQPAPWWLAVACLSLAWAVFIQFHPIVRTTIGPLTFAATDPTRPLLVATLTGGWFLCRKADVAGRITTWWKRDGSYVTAFTLGAFIGSLVFFWIYVGTYRKHPAFPVDQLVSALIGVDFPHGNWRALGVYQTLRSFILVFVVAALTWVPALGVGQRNRFYCLWFLLVSSIVLVIPVRFDEFSIWRVFLAPLPGLSSIRDPKRIIEVYELAVALLAALFLAELPRKSFFRVSIVIVVFLLLATSWNRSRLDFERPTSLFRRWVDAPIGIDPSCTSFFIRGASDAYMSRSFHKWGLYATDSMFIALKHSIPTLNGYSAWWPDGWELSNPQEPGYSRAVARWIDRHHLQGVCVLDIEARTMRPYGPAPAGR